MASPEPEPEQYNYPWATSPDILRTHQKDAYMTGTLATQLSTIIRELLGARIAHKYHNATTHLSELLYLCVTTLLGNRTLGEEYCDLIQVEDDTLRLVRLVRRVGYIASVVFSPWMFSKILPALRKRIRTKLERNIARTKLKEAQIRLDSESKSTVSSSKSLRFQEYVLTHLDAITSPSPVYALSLAAFYFTGAYYHLSKRIFRLRYIFTKQLSTAQANAQGRDGYEVLGVLLVLQMTVQSLLHVRETYLSHFAPESSSDPQADFASANAAQPSQPTTAMVGPGIEMPIGSDNLLMDLSIPSHLPPGIAQTTSTPVLPEEEPRYNVEDDAMMSWIPAGQQRKCTLCLETFRDPAATSCGHVFCWTCVQDWLREKAECPLCRQACLGSKVLPLRQ